MKSIRIRPEAVKACIHYLNRYGLRALWEKPANDTYTTFTGSESAITKIESFADGYMWKREG